MLEAQENSDTRGLLSSMMVRLPQSDRCEYSFRAPVNAIIFLAPISTFDQVLAEVSSLPTEAARLHSMGPKDPHVNRLEDSLLLWKSIVSNKLLCNVNIILFLNKCDLLQVCSRSQLLVTVALMFYQAKLDAGVRLNQHMVSYGDRPNDYDSISNCRFLFARFQTLFSFPFRF